MLVLYAADREPPLMAVFIIDDELIGRKYLLPSRKIIITGGLKHASFGFFRKRSN